MRRSDARGGNRRDGAAQDRGARVGSLARAAWCVVVGAWILLAFAYLLPQDFRSTSPAYVFVAWLAFMIRVFQFHVGLGVAAVAATAAVFGRRWRLAAAAAPVVAFALGPALLEHRPKPQASVSGETLTVMTMNLWHQNLDAAKAIGEIRRANPDLLLVQEYTPRWHEALEAALGDQYPHRFCLPQWGAYGGAIYSRRPLREGSASTIPLVDSAPPQLRVEMDLGGRTLAIYNIHLLSPGNWRRIQDGRLELAELVEVLDKEPLPALVGGDCNFPPTSPQAAELRRRGLTDAFSMAGRGRGATWRCLGPLRWAPGLRLDHVYLTDGLACVQCDRGRRFGSDHRPVIAEIGWRSPVRRGGRETMGIYTSDFTLPGEGRSRGTRLRGGATWRKSSRDGSCGPSPETRKLVSDPPKGG